MNLKTKDKVLNGVNKLADVVKLTLGTKGRTVLFKDDRDKPHITKDGVTVANNIFAEDDMENTVIAVLREASMKTMLSSGDGTTTTMILAQYLINEGYKVLEEGLSYYELKYQMQEALSDVKKYLTNSSIPVKDNNFIAEIASISANDESIGNTIKDIVDKIGLHGSIQVKSSNYEDTRIDETNGIKLHKGWYDSFMTNNKIDLTFEAEECNVLLIDGNIINHNQIIKYLECTKGKPLVIFCEEIGDIYLQQLNNFISTNAYPICFVQHDGFGERRMILLEDLSIYTGATIINPNAPFDPSYLGKVENIEVSENFTTLSGGYGDPSEIESLINFIIDLLEKDEDEDDIWFSNVEKTFHRKRLAGLTGGIANIYVGGKTEMEMKELKDRLDDAVLAVESAIKKGVSIGGGYTFVNCQNELRDPKKGLGYDLVINSLDQPFKQLLNNADLIKEYRNYKYQLTQGSALDLRNNQIKNVKDGNYKVYDPTSVLLDSITNAVTVANSLLSIKGIIYNNLVVKG